MRNMLLAICCILCFSCKKDPSEDITNYNWVLESEIVTPAITVNGVTSTNYMLLRDKESCAKNYTISFTKNGIFSVSSNGALCDMKSNDELQKWLRGGDKLSLNFGNDSVTSLTIRGDSLVGGMTLVINGKSYQVVSTYRAKTK